METLQLDQIQTQKSVFKWVESILLDIENGKRLYDQGFFNIKNDCGTAHCIAGWMVNDILDIEEVKCSLSEKNLHNHKDFKNKKTYTISKKALIYIAQNFINYVMFSDFIEQNEQDSWTFAKCLLGITDRESDLLFMPDLTIEEIIKNFHELKIQYGIESE